MITENISRLIFSFSSWNKVFSLLFGFPTFFLLKVRRRKKGSREKCVPSYT